MWVFTHASNSSYSVRCSFSDREISSNVSSQMSPKHSSQPARACLNLVRNCSLAPDSAGFVFGFRPATISFSNKDCMSSKKQKSARNSQAARPKSYTRTVHRLFTGPCVAHRSAILLGGLTAGARADWGREQIRFGMIAPQPPPPSNPRHELDGFVMVTVTVVPRPPGPVGPAHRLERPVRGSCRTPDR